MNISEVNFNMLLKPNYFTKETYRPIAIDRLNNKILVQAENERKLDISYKFWANANMFHKVDILI
jgi:hypothetical protein